jgi:hypothetical protein
MQIFAKLVILWEFVADYNKKRLKVNKIPFSQL